MWLFLGLILLSASNAIQLDMFTTSRDGAFKLTQFPPVIFSEESGKQDGGPAPNVTIAVNTSIAFQEIFGIGSSLEHSTCFNLMKMDPESRKDTLTQLFDPNVGIGISLMRLTIGSSDFGLLPFYSYDDSQSPDVTLSHFTIDGDRSFVIPALKETLAYTNQPDGLRFFASPWSPPGWMKSNNTLLGGRFNSAYTESYAKYLVKFIAAYQEEGVEITAITVQNEPLQNENSYPTTILLPEQEAKLIGKHLGPLFEEESNVCSNTSIWAFDHNWSDLYYPQKVLEDPEAYNYVSGTAFHLYSGRPEAMTKLHDTYPDKKIFFSEGSEFGLRGAEQIVAIFNNYASTYNAWVTMLDTEMKPNAGPFRPTSTMIELDTSTLQAVYRFEFFMTGQFSKFVRRGARRVQSALMSPGKRGRQLQENASGNQIPSLLSTATLNVSFVAFQNPISEALGSNSGTAVVVLVNPSADASLVRILWNGLKADVLIPPESVSTLRWPTIFGS